MQNHNIVSLNKKKKEKSCYMKMVYQSCDIWVGMAM